MKITREFKFMDETITKEIELTDEELYEAYRTYQHKDDILVIKERLKDSGEYENWEEIPEDTIAELALKYREHMEGFALTMGDNSIPSFEATVKDYAEVLEQYKEKWMAFSKEVTLTLTHEYTIRAKNKEDAERIFESWSEHHVDQMVEDLTEDARWDGDWDYGYTYEDSYTDPDNTDISEEDI